jgi:hypothetical protein
MNFTQTLARTRLGFVPTFGMGSREKRMGKWTFEDAVKFCDSPCYGELTDYHKEVFKVEHCFEDTKEDLEILQGRFPN